MRMAVEQPAFGGRRHIGELVPVARPVAVFSANAESLGKWLMAMLCCVVATGALSAPFNTETLLGTV